MNPLKRIAYEWVIPIMGCLAVDKNKYCNVIYYHDIVAGQGHSFMQTNIDVFKRQMEYIAQNGYETLRFDELGEPGKLDFKKKRIIIAFDDGWVSNYNEIFNFMKSLNLKYNIFLAVGLIGKDSKYLIWEMIREMHSSGICGFGTHTFSHTDLSHISDKIFEDEVTAADTKFKAELGYEPKDFCYPFGKYTKESNERLVGNSQYERIYLSDLQYSYKEKDKHIMGRNGISNDESFGVFKNKTKGYYNVFSLLKR